eukprot:TRINITY_DN16027_c0_g1_i1.p1 TRINITY_DN16027_c0_g1~~TRINITY_DN16027_c0_g1_i1.p1  ORF type:complete len:207 (+),score=40.03 TRINITY_DN16027_c0_g1_i1:28-648(+)
MQVLPQASNLMPSHTAGCVSSSAAAEGAKELITSEQWWQRTKSDKERLMRWLRNQYHGEVMASERLQGMLEQFSSSMTETQQKTVSIIAEQEKNHSEWVGALLKTRGEEPKVLQKVERYWDVVLTGLDSFLKATAVAAHAEEMRLERIRVIASDLDAPEDIRAVFQKILPQEEFHARAFKKMTSEEVYQSTTNAHELGRIALGLTP